MANHDDSEEWDDEDDEEMWQRSSNGRAPEHAPNPQYEAPKSPSKSRPPPNPRVNPTRPRSESRTDLPDPPPAPNGRTHNGVVRSQTSTKKKMSLPTPPANAFLNAKNMFEKPDNATIPRSNPSHRGVHATPSVPHHPTHAGSKPERPPRRPAIVPKPTHGFGHRPLPPTDRSGRSPRHHQENAHDTQQRDPLPIALKTAMDQRQRHQPPTPPANTTNGPPQIKNLVDELKAKGLQQSETRAHHPPSRTGGVRFEVPTEPPKPPPPRQIATVRPSPSTVGHAGMRHQNITRHPSMLPLEDPLHVRHWYHDKIDREEAERRLRQTNVNGAFLVRVGKQEQIPFVLSLIHNDHVYHTFVRKKVNGLFAAGKNEKPNEPEFECIEKLVAHYRDHEIYLMGKQPDTGIQCSTLLTMIAKKPLAR